MRVVGDRGFKKLYKHQKKLYKHKKTFCLFPREYNNLESLFLMLGLRPYTLAGGEQEGRKEGRKGPSMLTVKTNMS